MRGGPPGTGTGTSHWISLIWPPLPAFIDSPAFHGCLGLSLRRLSQEVYRTGSDQVGNSGGRQMRKTIQSLPPPGLPIPRRDHSQFLMPQVGGPRGLLPVPTGSKLSGAVPPGCLHKFSARSVTCPASGQYPGNRGGPWAFLLPRLGRAS